MTIDKQCIAQMLAISALALGLAACDKQDNQTAGHKLDNAIEQTEQAVSNARMEAERAMQSASQKVENAAANIKDAAENSANAAMNTANDAGIIARINAVLLADAQLSAIKINVRSQSGVVTLTGEAPSQDAKDRASQIAEQVQGVLSVNNQLTLP